MIAATPADLVAPLIGSLISFFDQRVGRDASRDRLALDTIEAMAVAANRKGRIARSRASRQYSAAARCPECSYFPAKPMSAKNVRDARRVVELAHIDDAVAFAFAKTTVLLTVASRPGMCRCDLLAWERAIDQYRRSPARAWRSIGIVP